MQYNSYERSMQYNSYEMSTQELKSRGMKIKRLREELYLLKLYLKYLEANKYGEPGIGNVIRLICKAIEKKEFKLTDLELFIDVERAKKARKSISGGEP